MGLMTKREEEFAAIDARIEAIKKEKITAENKDSIAQAIARLEDNADYKLVIEKTFIDDEISEITNLLGGDKILPSDMVEQMNKSLEAIRAFKSFITYSKELGEGARVEIENCDARIREEVAYRTEVSQGKVDLGEIDG